MRPPYLSTNALVLQTMGELAYHVINCDIDTKDYANDSPDLIQTAKDRFAAGVAAGGTIELTHDTHKQTVNNMTQFMIDTWKGKGVQSTCSRSILTPSSPLLTVVGRRATLALS